MSDNPYESPAEISSVDFSAENIADTASRRLGWFVCTVLTFDCLPCLFRLFVLVFFIKTSIRHYNPPLSEIAGLCLMVGIVAFSLSGNICLLLKKMVGIPLVITGLVLSTIYWNIAMWLGISEQPPSNFTAPQFLAFLAVIAISAAGWLILYGFVVWKTAKKLRWLQRKARLEEQTG
jgi:hypothetical protein